MPAQHYVIYKQQDYSKEFSSTKIYNAAVTALNIAAYLTSIGTLRTAIEGITLGTMANEQWIGDNTLLSSLPPTNEFAHREIKWKVVYIGNTSGKQFTLTIPCADPVGMLLEGTDFMDMSQTAPAAFKTAFEAFARSPENDAETVTISYVEFVGRNL